MHSLPRSSRRRADQLALVGLVGLVAACSSIAAPSPSPTPSRPPQGTVPSQPQVPDPDSPVGIVLPPGGDPGASHPVGRIVSPRPGQLDVHPIPAQSLSAAVSGRHVVVTVAFTSGVEPCSVLDSIVVQRGVGTFAITLREGHGPGNVACIEMAEFRRALVDLGELATGTHTISDAAAGAVPIIVDVR